MESETKSSSPLRRRVIVGAVALGSVIGAADVANAVTTPSQTSDTTTSVQGDATAAAADGTAENPADEATENNAEDVDGHDGRRGGGDETPLAAGAVADQVTAAAETAVPGGTVTMVEQQGTGFEAHVTDASGAEVEVHFDANMAVIDVGQGH